METKNQLSIVMNTTEHQIVKVDSKDVNADETQMNFVQKPEVNTTPNDAQQINDRANFSIGWVDYNGVSEKVIQPLTSSDGVKNKVENKAQFGKSAPKPTHKLTVDPNHKFNEDYL